MLLDARHPGPALSRVHRVFLVALLVLGGGAVVLGGARPVAAHNQRTAFSGVFGPYDVVATARDVAAPGPGDVQFDLVIRTAAGRDPVEDATVRVSSGTGEPMVAERYGNVYRVVLSVGNVERWMAQIEIDGSPGSTRITRSVLGPASLHGLGGGFSDREVPSSVWLVLVVAGLVAMPLIGLTSYWRMATSIGGGLLIVFCVFATAQAWSRSSDPIVERSVALLPQLLGVILLVAGLVLTQQHRRDASMLVFGGSAALMAIFGWVNRYVLTTSEVPGRLSPFVARSSTAAALGLGGGLALLVLVRSRSEIQDLFVSAPGGVSAGGEVAPIGQQSDETLDIGHSHSDVSVTGEGQG